MKTVLFLALLLPFLCHSKDLATRTNADGVKITLTDEPCQLMDFVTNLPRRAKWNEKGNIIEGCYTALQVNPAVVLLPMYWGDKTVGLDILSNYEKLEGV